jgi:hypothetical protein
MFMLHILSYPSDSSAQRQRIGLVFGRHPVRLSAGASVSDWRFLLLSTVPPDEWRCSSLIYAKLAFFQVISISPHTVTFSCHLTLNDLCSYEQSRITQCIFFSPFIATTPICAPEYPSRQNAIYCPNNIIPRVSPLAYIVVTNTEVRFQVLTAADMKMTVFWDVVMCRPVEIWLTF